ncbi:MAG: hypothetical protein OSA04_05925 [Flavobacteriales bacterium]|nr:hypothetical protein [Flavobacteriales bacterium]
MNSNYKIIFLFALPAMFSGCGLWSDKPGDPFEVIVSSFDLVTTQDQGTSSHNIKEVWVYTETDVLGVFPLPASIPYITDANVEVSELVIQAGIRVNGISATRKPYPFYKAMELEVENIPGGSKEVAFASNYIESAQIILAEDFESANRFEANNTSTAEVVRTVDPDLVFEGNASGLILLSPEQSQVSSTTQEQLYNLPQSGPIYLEFNYRCDNSFAVGLEAIGGGNPQRTPIIVLNPTGEEWKKMYLDLAPLVFSTPTAFGYELTLDAILDLGEASGYVVVDNFKLVYYK